MKKFLSLLLSFTLVLSLTACSSTGGSPESSEESSDAELSEMESSDTEMTGTESAASSETEILDGESANTQSRRVLVAYFSWAENAVLEEDVDAVASPSVISPGNVQQLAGWVQEVTGGDLFSIQVTEPYPSDWDACLSRANEERGADARPQLVQNVEDMDQYDTIFLGYPKMEQGYICV